jgi:hypothetical protein
MISEMSHSSPLGWGGLDKTNFVLPGGGSDRRKVFHLTGYR